MHAASAAAAIAVAAAAAATAAAAVACGSRRCAAAADVCPGCFEDLQGLLLLLLLQRGGRGWLALPRV
jgi:hypothetical protein